MKKKQKSDIKIFLSEKKKKTDKQKMDCIMLNVEKPKYKLAKITKSKIRFYKSERVDGHNQIKLVKYREVPNTDNVNVDSFLATSQDLGDHDSDDSDTVVFANDDVVFSSQKEEEELDTFQSLLELVDKKNDQIEKLKNQVEELKAKLLDQELNFKFTLDSKEDEITKLTINRDYLVGLTDELCDELIDTMMTSANDLKEKIIQKIQE